jgi:hypothetical protein
LLGGNLGWLGKYINDDKNKGKNNIASKYNNLGKSSLS